MVNDYYHDFDYCKHIGCIAAGANQMVQEVLCQNCTAYKVLSYLAERGLIVDEDKARILMKMDALLEEIAEKAIGDPKGRVIIQLIKEAETDGLGQASEGDGGSLREPGENAERSLPEEEAGSGS